MNILSIETSVATGSVALQHDDQVRETFIETPRTHAEQLIPRIEILLAESGITLSQLDAIAFGSGPGSFIGVRLASAVAQGLAVGANIGLAPVSSMAALAGRAAEISRQPLDANTEILVCLDARMQEVYCAQYLWRNGQIESSAPQQLLKPEAVTFPSSENWVAAGSGFDTFAQLHELARSNGAMMYPEIESCARELLPFAQSAIRADQLVAADAWRGEYLRTRSAWQSLK